MVRDDDGQVAVAVDDLSSGADAADSGTQEFMTASIVKVGILGDAALPSAAVRPAAHPGNGSLLATTMIENSNDDAASELYDEAGGAVGIDQANQVFGLGATTVGTAGYWGLTSTTVDDQILLLRQVFTRPSVLTVESQDYIQDLMSQVEADQLWGVPAAADAGTAAHGEKRLAAQRHHRPVGDQQHRRGRTRRPAHADRGPVRRQRHRGSRVCWLVQTVAEAAAGAMAAHQG